ncbi:lasso peptide biosynthesis B2 protein [Emticicia soli]|uniref:Lasso peptide biosynthesis B2 protein n=1 Tax=Emticicia soli TaxID=2027878 RepID=A0ABW5J3W2_9BACT
MKTWQKVRSFMKLSVRQKLLIFFVGFLSFYSFLLFKFFKQRATFGRISSGNQGILNLDMNLVNDIRFAIRIVEKYTVWKNVCRHQAYQAMILCKYYQIPYQIFIGFKKGGDGKIEGHAWTLVGNQIITGFCKPEEYVIQAIYS